jgi:hypothetical protein
MATAAILLLSLACLVFMAGMAKERGDRLLVEAQRDRLLNVVRVMADELRVSFPEMCESDEKELRALLREEERRAGR